MPISTLDEYARLSDTAKGKLSKADLKTIINNQVNANTLGIQNTVNINEIKETIVDVITRSLEHIVTTKIKEIIEDIKGIVKADIDPMKVEIKSLREDLDNSKDQCKIMKKVILEQQKTLEYLKRDRIRHNVFISGIPNTIKINNNDTANNKIIVDYILKFLLPNIKDEDYKINKEFDSKVGFNRHSVIISLKNSDKKTELLQKCKDLKSRTEENSWLRKVFIKSEQTPLTSKENSRLYKKFKDLKTKYEDDDTNLIQLDKGKLYHNEIIIDEFNLENQIF